jgi:hypothetical protein
MFPANAAPSLDKTGMELKRQYMKKDGMQMKRRRSSKKLIGCGLISR